jgi:hypothetical protein
MKATEEGARVIMPTMDEEIARHLREAAASGELQRIPGYGKPLPEDAGWDATPEELRMPFKILKNAGFVPPELELFHQRAALTKAIEDCHDASERQALQTQLSHLQQKLTLRLEAMRSSGNL